MEGENRIAFIQLHIAVFLFGFTAILGEVINLHPLALTWWRVLFTFGFFMIVPKYFKSVLKLPMVVVGRFFLAGIVLAIHWLTFYWSIKASNASIALVCLATTSFFTAFFEPLILKTKWKKLQIMSGLIIVPAMLIIAHSSMEKFGLGILLGIISAICAAIFPSMNKKWMGAEDPVALSAVQMLSATIVLSIVILIANTFGQEISMTMDKIDLLYMLILSLLCTNLAYVFALKALKHISAFASALTINLEPIYGIVLAAILFKQYESLDINFYIGAAMIILAVWLYPILAKRFELKEI